MATSVFIPNAPSELDMNAVRAKMDAHEGLSKSCRFAVKITPPRSMYNDYQRDAFGMFSDLTYLCEATEFPGRGFMSVDVTHYGPSHKLPYQTSYEDCNMTFLVRSRSAERRLFDDWMEQINPSQTFDFNYRDDYSTTIEIYQFSDVQGVNVAGNNEATYSFTLYNAYPTVVSPQPVTWADDNFQRLTVTFTFTKWRRRGMDMTYSAMNR
jgi:hypothetical protein